MNVLVIGGAGFIGSHLVDALLAHGHRVRVFDSLDPQVHPEGRPPAYLSREAEFVHAGAADRASLVRALTGIEGVYYLAGAVGVGDSMYRVRRYAELNLLGPATFLDVLANERPPLRKVILSSSVVVYGHGKYRCPRHGVVFPEARDPAAIAARRWDPVCAQSGPGGPCGSPLAPLPIDEATPPRPLSFYAVTKRGQEDMFRLIGAAYGVPVVLLRFFNVYGSRQAPGNPYSGVVKLFAQALASGTAPVVYEDGLQTRDLVHVSDVARASVLALESDAANGGTFNVGTGRITSVLDVVAALGRALGRDVHVAPVQRYRAGDVRHCSADISRIRAALGFEPLKPFPAGLEDVLDAVAAPVGESAAEAHRELERRGLIR